MRRGLLLVGLIWMAAEFASAAFAEEVPADASSAVIDAKIAGWKARTVRLGTGRMLWRLAAQARSAEFGGATAAGSETPSSERVVVQFQPRGLRLEGDCFPSINFGKPVLPNQNDDRAKQRYGRALAAGFRGKDFFIPRTESYTILADAYEETHCWTSVDPARPSIVTLPAGTAGPLQFYDWSQTTKLPLVLALVEAMQLSLHPEMKLIPRAFEANRRVLNLTPQFQGRTCGVVEYDYRCGQVKGTCRLWLDPGRDDVVIRAIYSDASQIVVAQYDFEYDQPDGKDWWPLQVTVLQTNSYGDGYDEVRAVRAEWNNAAATSVENGLTKPPSGARIREEANGNYFYIPAAGLKQKISPADAAAYLSGKPRAFAGDYAGAVAWRAARRDALRMLTWPRILLVMPFAWLAWQGAKNLPSYIRTDSMRALLKRQVSGL